jgi:hypothetical protein
MKSFYLKILNILIISVLTFPTIASAQTDPDLLKLGAQVYDGISKASEALSDLRSVEQVVKDIEEGKTPSVSENRWAKLASNYRSVAKQIKEASLPTDFDQTKYKVSVDELKNCATREASLIKLQGFLKELKEGQVRGKAAMTDLERGLSEADKAHEALRYLIEVHKKLVNVPIYGSIFTWDWFELETEVSASLADLTTSLKSQRKKITEELAKLSLYIPNLEGNLTLFDPLSCSIVGKWEGKRIFSFLPEKEFPFSVEFTKDGSSYAGTMTSKDFLGATITEKLSVMNVSGQNIEFDTTQFALCKGTLSPDYRQITATMLSPEGKPAGSCNLIRKP